MGTLRQRLDRLEQAGLRTPCLMCVLERLPVGDEQAARDSCTHVRAPVSLTELLVQVDRLA